MAPPDTPEPAAEPSSQAVAREYESAHNRLFVIRIALTLAALAVYLLTGASADLAAGLRRQYGSAWIVNGLYTLITVFGFAAFMFPLSLYSDFVLEHRYGLSRQGLESWFFDFLKGLALELALAAAFFEVIYALLRWTPAWWWAWATLFYVLFAVVLSSIAPVVIMPLFHKFKPLDNPSLTEAVKAFVEREGLRVLGVYSWGLEEKTATANAALAGLGRTRRIILGDTMLKGYTQEEIIAVLAHEVGHYKHRDMLRLIVSGAALAAAGFYIASVALHWLVARFGFEGPHDIGSFPLFIFCLFVFSLVTMPLSNAYSRRREFAADAYAVRAVGSAAPLTAALEKLADQNLADKEPAGWIEFLLHSHPSIARRVRRARDAEREQAR
jgi:STE24 endopeptidase